MNMDSELVKAFNAELVSLYELRPPISKKKIVDITKAALKAIKYYKHVVFGVEKFLTKCKPEYKIPGLYCIDSIIRQSKHQFKNKDVFGPRFANNMSTTLLNLLNCKHDDKLKVVRVLNLWKSHEIFDENRVRPWLEYCRVNHGLEIEIERVEKSVKGEEADLSIYERSNSKVEKKKINPKTPPPPPQQDIRCNAPMQLRKPSDEAVEGGISEHETLIMLNSMGLDPGGMFTLDHSLLQKIHKIVNNKLVERREIDSRRQGNIKNLLSKEFDYSDEESDDDDGEKKLHIEARPAELTKQQIMGMAEAVLREADTKEEIQRIHSERLSAISQISTAVVRNQSSQQIPMPMPSASAISNLSSDKQFLNAISAVVPLNPVIDANMTTPSISTGMPFIAPQLIPIPATGNPSQNMHPSFPFNIPPHNLNASLSMAQTGSQNQYTVNRLRNDLDDRGQQGRTRDHRDERRRERDHDKDDIRGFSSKRSRRSRSKDRNDTHRSGRDSSRGHDRNENHSYRDAERQRRKMGLPWPPKEGHVLIASCTLWLGRIPSNCTEDDIRQAFIEAGEPARISIIHSRACAYVAMKDRKAAFRVIDRLQRSIQICKKDVKLNWGIGQGLKGDKYMDYWDSNRGYSLIPHNVLPDNLESLLDGSYLDVDSLPTHLAHIYDEYGLKGKQRGEARTVLPAEMQLPSGIPPFAYAGGAAPHQYFPPNVLAYPSAMHPEPASTISSMTVQATESKPIPVVAPSTSFQQKMVLPSSQAPRIRPSRPDSAHFMPRNYSNQMHRFPGDRGGFIPQSDIRNSRPPFMPRGNFRTRLPFPPPTSNQFPIRPPPHMPPNMTLPLNRTVFPYSTPSQYLVPDLKGEEQRTVNQNDHNSSIPSVGKSDMFDKPLSYISHPPMDDSTNEPVTSTTHDDDTVDCL